MAEKFHNDADKMAYRFHQPDNAEHYEAPAEDAETESKTDDKSEPETKSSTTKTSAKSTSTAKEK